MSGHILRSVLSYYTIPLNSSLGASVPAWTRAGEGASLVSIWIGRTEKEEDLYIFVCSPYVRHSLALFNPCIDLIKFFALNQFGLSFTFLSPIGTDHEGMHKLSRVSFLGANRVSHSYCFPPPTANPSKRKTLNWQGLHRTARRNSVRCGEANLKEGAAYLRVGGVRRRSGFGATYRVGCDVAQGGGYGVAQVGCGVAYGGAA